MQELENLLTSLVERGWKPKYREVVSIKLDQEFTKSEWKTVFYCSCKDWFWFYADLRWIVSLESGLWQFVCINDLYKYSSDELVLNPSWGPDWLSADWSFFCGDSAYRLLESSLIPEEELGKFLVDNIKVEWKKE